MFQRLYSHFGPQGWWPGETREEICIGAILTQNTNWQNVARAIANLKQAGCITFPSLALLPIEALAELIRPAGYYNIKARRLRNFVEMVNTRFSDGLDGLFSLALDEARNILLEVKGIGPETADSILLYAGGMPTFVVDAYTIRILSRHDIIPEEVCYDEVRELFMDNLPNDPKLFNEFHALFVAAGKHYCKKRRPKCGQCPLEGT